MPSTLLDGSVLYQYPDQLASITFNDVDLPVADAIEVLVQPDGWGRVLVLKALDTADVRVKGEGKDLVDGTKRNFTYWGKVAVTLP